MMKPMEYLAKIKKGSINKKMQNLIVFGLIGIALILAGTFFIDQPSEESSKEDTYRDNPTIEDYEEKIKNELVQILGAIDGVGKVDVMVTIANESEAEIAFNTTESQSITEEKDNQGGERVTDQNNLSETAVMINEGGGNSPFVTRQNKPEIKGVMVVAEGAHNPQIKYQLHQAVQTALELPSHKVVIYAMQK